ncbi:hypothetical protein scyTo_0023957, partial [Scyliorhinus torazame]|nr:hypothetical protein [Scyliorhinus torazame]
DMKIELLDQFKAQLSELLDKAIEESIAYQSECKQMTKCQDPGHRNRPDKLATEKGKIFVNRRSMLE